MWPIRFVGLQPRDVPVCHLKDENLGEVELPSLSQDMVRGRLDCRTLPILGLAIVHDDVAEGAHATHRPPKTFPDGLLPLHLRCRKMGVDNDCIIGKNAQKASRSLAPTMAKVRLTRSCKAVFVYSVIIVSTVLQ
jgi:hypothetical protein